MSFGKFITQIQLGAKLYLRSLSENPSLVPANISRDFPSLSSDFALPPELSFVTENIHSSPLRISGPVIIWLHYDVSKKFQKCHKSLLLISVTHFTSYTRHSQMFSARYEVKKRFCSSILWILNTLTLNPENQAHRSICFKSSVINNIILHSHMKRY